MNLLPLLNVFPKKVRVTFIDAVSGNTINKRKVLLAELPEAFNKPITMNIGDNSWRVINAMPARVEEYSVSGRLLLHLQQLDTIAPSALRCALPTIAPTLPVFTDNAQFHDFTLELNAEDWRQIEFMPQELLPLIKEEMDAIEAILYPEDETQNLLGFARIHARYNTNHPYLNIPFDKFCNKIKAKETGNILFKEHGYVQDGFAIRSDSFCYYGIVKEGRILQLNLWQFESADEEFLRVLIKYDLVLANWCKGLVIGA